MRYIIPASLVLACALSGIASASVDQATEQRVREAINQINPGAPIDALNSSPLPGFTTVLSHGEVIFVANTGTHIFIQGKLFRVSDRFDETAAAMQPYRAAVLTAVPAESYITFKAPNEKYVVTVFTDVECGYCKMLHSHIAEYNAAGITVKYLSFPRSGPGSPGFKSAETIWCSPDPAAALSTVKAGGSIPEKSCDNPVGDMFNAALSVGVRATPAIYTADGRELGGYLDTAKMVEALTKTP